MGLFEIGCQRFSSFEIIGVERGQGCVHGVQVSLDAIELVPVARRIGTLRQVVARRVHDVRVAAAQSGEI